MTVTKKEIADYLGLSRAAVSLALNNTPNSTLSEKTRQRILTAAKELGYRESEVAPKICYIFYKRNSDDPRYLGELKSAEEVASRCNYSIVFMNIPGEPQHYKRLQSFLKSSDIIGVIVTGALDDNIIELVEGSGLPHVFYGMSERNDIHKISYDFRKAAYQATQYLISLGHTKIAFFSGSLNLHIHKEELEGYRNALQESGVFFDKAMVQVGKEEDGYELCSRAEVLDLDYTAAVCANTVIQFGILQRLKERGIQVPGSVSLIGTGFTQLVKQSVPQLTTFHADSSSREQAVDYLIDCIREMPSQKRQIRIDSFELFSGGTVAICKETEFAN